MAFLPSFMAFLPCFLHPTTQEGDDEPPSSSTATQPLLKGKSKIEKEKQLDSDEDGVMIEHGKQLDSHEDSVTIEKEKQLSDEDIAKAKQELLQAVHIAEHP